VEQTILTAEHPVEQSIQILCDHSRTILNECRNLGIPLGISCESVSIFKAEIDGVHELFRRLQSILMDHRGSPWKVQWVDLPLTRFEAKETTTTKEEEQQRVLAKGMSSEVVASLMGAVTGGALVALGVLITGSRQR
jgi:hypothetical protein